MARSRPATTCVPEPVNPLTLSHNFAKGQSLTRNIRVRTARSRERKAHVKNGDDRGIHASITKGQRLDPVTTNKIAQMTTGNKRFLATEKEWAPPLARREGHHAQLKPTEETPSTPTIGQGDNTIIAQPRANVNPSTESISRA